MRKLEVLLCLLLASTGLAAQEAPPAEGAPRVRVVTSAGNFVIELDRNRAPGTVEAFLKYVKEGFSPGVMFPPAVAGFIAQAGAYTPDLQPKPVTEDVVNESGNGLSNLRGSGGFARSNDP